MSVLPFKVYVASFKNDSKIEIAHIDTYIFWMTQKYREMNAHNTVAIIHYKYVQNILSFFYNKIIISFLF